MERDIAAKVSFRINRYGVDGKKYLGIDIKVPKPDILPPLGMTNLLVDEDYIRDQEPPKASKYASPRAEMDAPVPIKHTNVYLDGSKKEEEDEQVKVV
jgi:hypothetical protein